MADAARWVPSNAKGVVTTAMVRAPSAREVEATAGAAPEPVPPPSLISVVWKCVL